MLILNNWKKIKKQYTDSTITLSSSNNDTNRLISFLWLILTIIIIIFTVKAFITKINIVFNGFVELIFIHSVLFVVINELFYYYYETI